MSSTRGGKLRRMAAFPCGKRTKYLVVAFWIVVIALTGSLAGKLQGAERNDASAYLPASADSTQELNLQAKFTSKDLNPAVVIYQRQSGITAADVRKATADARSFAALPAVDGRVTGPVVSRDHRAIATTVGADLGFNADFGKFVGNMRATASRGDPGLTVALTGPAASAADQLKIFKGIDSTLLYATLAVVILLLLVTYRSPILWLLPILSAGVALTFAEAVIYLLTQHANLTVNGQSGGILVVLVLGAGTDYALLLVARYREELRRHEDRHEAMAEALRRAGPAIVASAGTVIASMLCLLVAQSADISGLGPVAAIGIAVGLLAMITLLPALLVICGRWVFWPVRPRLGSAEPTRSGVWARVGRMIAGRPRVIWGVTAVLLACASLGLVGFKIGTLTTAQSFRGSPSSVAGEQVLAAHFPAGSGEPVAVIGNASAAPQMRAALAATPGIAQVGPPQVKDGLAYLQGTLAGKPDSPAAYAAVDRVRDSLGAIKGADAKVGGATAIAMDVGHYVERDRNIIIPLVLLVVLLILGLLLQSVVAPLILIGTVVLSFGAALGLSALAFRHWFGFAGADTSMPLFVFVFLVALGIDYNIFLMTRVREEAARSGTRQGALTGLGATGGVITAAGLVLAGTFASLATLPLTEFTEIGFAVALGVLLDTIIVRSVLVTALNLDIGRHMWWPSQAEQADHRAGQHPGRPVPGALRLAPVRAGTGAGPGRAPRGARPGRGSRLDDRARLARRHGLGIVDPPDHRHPAGRGHEPAHRLDLRPHRARREAERTQLLGGGVAQRPGLRRAVAGQDRVHVGQQQQDVGVERAGQQRGGQILVHDGFSAVQPPGAVPGDRYPAAAGADHDHALAQQAADRGQVDQLDRLGRGHHPAPGAAVLAHLPAPLSRDLKRLGLRVDRADELGRRAEGRIVGAYYGPADQAGRRPVRDRVLDRLQQPVADHALSLGAEHIERIRAGQQRVLRALHGQQADLGAVAVREHQLVLAGQRHQGLHRLPDVRLLGGGVGPLTAFQQRVTAQRGDDPHSAVPIVAAISALIVCSRFSA